MKTSHLSGFTLIEILVVVTIIAILSTVVYGSLTDSLDSADGKGLMSDLKQAQLAIETYEAQKGEYPKPNTTTDCGVASPSLLRSSHDTCTRNYILDLVPDYMDSLPAPVMSGCSIEYQTDPAGTWYKLTAVNCLAEADALDLNDRMARCPASCMSSSGICSTTDENFATSFAVYSRGGECQ